MIRTSMRFRLSGWFTPLLLLATASTGSGQGFGQGLLKSKRTVTLHRKLPATVNLKGGTIDVKASASDKQNSFAVDKLVETLEAELLKYNNQFKVDSAQPDTLITCKITDLLIPPTKIVTRNVAEPVKGGKIYQTQQVPVRFQEVTGSINVAYQVKDRGGKVLDADNLSGKYDQEFDAGGNKTDKSLKDKVLTNPFHKKSSEEKAEEAPPTAPELQQLLVRKIVLQIAARLTNTDENVEVRLARGSLDQYNDFAEKGLWNRMLEPLETLKPLDTPEEDSFRLYNIGVGYEALAYQAEDLKAAKKYLDEAAINYGKAVDTNPHEKEFLDAQNRIATAQAHYAKLGSAASAASPVAKAASPASAPAALPSRSPAQARVQASSAAATAPSDDTLTNAQVIELFKQGMDEENLIATIKDAHKVNFDLSTNGQMELLKGGIKGKVLMAMRARAHPAVHHAAAPKAATTPTAPAPAKP
jgi:hypothetical protein